MRYLLLHKYWKIGAKNVGIFMFLICFSVSLNMEAQTKTSKRELNKLTKQAEDAFYNENYREAIALYQQLYNINPDGGDYYNYQIALCHLYSNIDNRQALNYLDMAEEALGESDIAVDYYTDLAKAFHLNYRFDDAIDMYNKALSFNMFSKNQAEEINKQIEQCKHGAQFKKDSSDISILNAGANVNSSYRDYKPVISADESALIFTTRRKGVTGDKLAQDGRYYEDIYSSYKDDFGYWVPPVNISPVINTPEHQASIGLSPDGRELFFYNGTKGEGAIYSSKRLGDKWTVPQILNKNINSEKSLQTSASISPDGKTLYFTSDRKGGIGGMDIYKSELEADGDWGKAINLGPVINTPDDEESPFIHPDGKTLYFSSKGHNTMGGFDIFMTFNIDGLWSKPTNMGYPLNSPGDDLHFTLSANGKNGYFTSSRTGSVGETDIFKAKLQKETPLVLVKGILRGDEKGELIFATISPIDKETKQKIKYVYNPDPYTGEYLMVLPPGKSYDLMIEAQGFQPYVVTASVPDKNQFYEMYQEINLKKIKAGDKEIGQEVTITSAIIDKTDSSATSALGKLPEQDYLATIASKIVEITDTAGENFDKEMLAKEVNKISAMTESAIVNYDSLIVQKELGDSPGIEIQAVGGTFITTGGMASPALQPYITGTDTLYVIPPQSFDSTALKERLAKIEAEKARQDKARAEKELDSILAQVKTARQMAETETGNAQTDVTNWRTLKELESKVAEKANVIATKEAEVAKNEAIIVQKETAALKEHVEKIKSVSKEIPPKNKEDELALQKHLQEIEQTIEQKQTVVQMKEAIAAEKEVIAQQVQQLPEEKIVLKAETDVAMQHKTSTEKEVRKLEEELKTTVELDKAKSLQEQIEKKKQIIDANEQVITQNTEREEALETIIEVEKEDRANELSQLKEDLSKAKAQPQTGNYVLDIANERYIENLDEEIAALEGGFAVRPRKPTAFAEVIQKETTMYGTTVITDEKSDKKYEREITVKEKTGDEKVAVLVKEEKKKEIETAKLDDAPIAKEIKTNLTTTNTAASIAEKVIYFEYDKSNIHSNFNKDLDEIAEFMKKNAASKVEIVGHTDANGSLQYNMQLSRRRAEAAVRYISSKGVSRNKMALKYLGESQPVAPNATPDGTDYPEGRNKNRRVELKVK